MSAKDATIGIDIGTTSVKAVAADEDGRVTARTRIPHRLRVPAPDLLEHDAEEAWRRGPLTALAELGGNDAAAVAVTAMVPSMTAVDDDGTPLTPGLLYGDRRGQPRTREAGPDTKFLTGEAVGFLRWTAEQAPDARGYWPAMAVANHALAGAAVIDTTTASTTYPLFDGSGWNSDICADVGVTAGGMPRVAATGTAVGRVRDMVLATGAVDAVCEQIVAGADAVGDVLVLCGTTLIVWATIGEYREVPGLWTLPHTATGKCQIGGPSNAGGLFLGWVDGLLGAATGEVDPGSVPVWSPYIRGERAPFHDPDRRAVLDGLNLTHDSASVRRAAFEASGFVVRQLVEMGGAPAARIVATGGGTRVEPWLQAIADATGLPVHVSAVPEGAALGAAFLGRMAAGLETSIADAARWARTDHIVEPDPGWAAPTAERYGRFLELAKQPPR